MLSSYSPRRTGGLALRRGQLFAVAAWLAVASGQLVSGSEGPLPESAVETGIRADPDYRIVWSDSPAKYAAFVDSASHDSD